MWGSAAALLAAGHRVISYDRRGYSRSPSHPSGDHNQHADDAAALLRALDAVPATVVGWSTGGTIALALAIRYPELVRHLVLQEPPLFAGQSLSVSAVRHFVPILVLGTLGRRQQAAERFLRWTYSSGGTGYDRFPVVWREAARRNSTAIMVELAGGTGERVVTAALIGTIRHPATGLVGELTLPYLRRCTERIERLLPQMTVQTIPGGNHAMHLDNPGAWAAAVRVAAGDARPPG
jgi:pimeloyl-ACP methyl ester carboxylesterase